MRGFESPGSRRWLEVSGRERCIGPELGGNWTMRESTFTSEGRALPRVDSDGLVLDHTGLTRIDWYRIIKRISMKQF